jgi:diacylglycerol kinase (ATP)
MGMKFVKLLHNPGAGDREHSGEDLAAIIESAGFECSYASTKKLDKPVVESSHIDLVALAGGDGTIRKIAKELLEEDLPIGLFPMGTANNIAKSLHIPDDPTEIVKGWKKEKIKPFDVGRITGLDEETFFLEGVGFGVFPLLMQAMKGEDKKLSDDPDKRIKTALEHLIGIVQVAATTRCEITVDGTNYSGNFILAEVMNTRSIGPNLNLSPLADPGDGKFEVVLISDDQRETFLDYVSAKTSGTEKKTFFNIIQGSNIDLFWHGTGIHIDDERKYLDEPLALKIQLQPGAFRFLVP